MAVLFLLGSSPMSVPLGLLSIESLPSIVESGWERELSGLNFEYILVQFFSSLPLQYGTPSLNCLQLSPSIETLCFIAFKKPRVFSQGWGELVT